MNKLPVFDGLYRRLFCRGGYGVHSPFVFDLITTVIEERKAYYCYEALGNARKQLQRELDGKAIARRKRFCFSERENRLLFRLANRFRPQNILVAGSDWGLTPVCLTAYTGHTHCAVFEPEPAAAAVAREYAAPYARGTIEYGGDLLAMLDKYQSFDMIVWGDASMPVSPRIVESLLPRLHAGSVMAVASVHASEANKAAWAALCACPKASATVDLGRLGLVFFNPILHRHTYKAALR